MADARAAVTDATRTIVQTVIVSKTEFMRFTISSQQEVDLSTPGS